MNVIPSRWPCPCCGREVPVRRQAGLSKALQAFQAVAEGGASGHAPALGADAVRNGSWACDGCLRADRAVPADAACQKFCCCPPRLAYFDRGLRCSVCGKDFVFSATDQKAWYEKYGIWTFVEPRNCLPCRRRVRARKRAAGRIGEVLRSLDPKSSRQLAEVAALYLQAGHLKKASEFFRRARNRAATPEEIEALTKSILESESGAGAS